jgi:hypothetical protein
MGRNTSRSWALALCLVASAAASAHWTAASARSANLAPLTATAADRQASTTRAVTVHVTGVPSSIAPGQRRRIDITVAGLTGSGHDA